jgi:pimeloyl-ACP methyl ester carboxylesterase
MIMRTFLFSSVFLLLFIVQVFSQHYKYPDENFYNRNLELPVDYQNIEEGKFNLYYEVTSNFNYNRPTIFFLYDTQQQYGEPGQVDDLAKRYQFFEHFNVVRIQLRGREYSYINLKNEDKSVQWERAYRILSSKQIIEDIERVRQNLFSDQSGKEIYLFGRSGGGYLVQEYLAKYSQNVRRAFIEVAPNPLIMEDLGFIESKYLYDLLNSIDPELHEKLKTVIEKGEVPELKLLWILKGIPYKSENPKEELALLINELSIGKMELYDEYLAMRGFDFSKVIPDEKTMGAWEMGCYLRPLECDGTYILGPKPDYVDPLYTTLRKISDPYIQLIEEEKVKPIEYPSLEKFKTIKTEVFFLAGRNDHVTPYQIGIELKKLIKNFDLYIADDNHNLTIYKECSPLLRNAFFNYGIDSKKLHEVKNSLECKEWYPN